MRDVVQDGSGNVVSFIEWPDNVDGTVNDNGVIRALTPDERVSLQLRLDAQAARLVREANAADKAARIQALAARSVSQLETSAGQIDARAAVYEAFPDVATNGQTLTRVNVITDDVAALARRVADLQQTVAHLIRLTVIDNG